MSMSEASPWAPDAAQARRAETEAAQALELFHPAVKTWFERRFPHGPTQAQARG